MRVKIFTLAVGLVFMVVAFVQADQPTRREVRERS